MSWAKRLMVAVSLFALPSVLAAQATTGRITGTVTDSSNGQPLPGVNVLVVGTRLGATTGADGHYTIVGASAGAQQIRAQRIGFAPVTRTANVVAGESVNLSFGMRAQSVQLDAVVSVGYGTQSKRDVTGAVSTVTTEALDKAPIATVDQLLQGTSPGVQVTTASSEPGGAISVRIRGMSSITGNSEPLYVVDGFPIENDPNAEAAGNGGRSRTTPPNPLVTLNPNDIESISILKDASATAIYGSRGANGVVIITTKQGTGTHPTFTFDSYVGQSSVAKRYDLLNATQYMNYANTFGQNSSTPFTPFPDSVKQTIIAAGINTDWQNQIFRTAPVSNVQVGVRGATSAASPTRYVLSGGVFDQQGVVVGSGIRRLSARANLDQAIGDRIELGATLTGSQARTKSTPTSGQQNGNAGAVSAALQYVPILPVRRADGTYSYILTDLNAYNSLLDAPPTDNPVALARDVIDSLSDTRLLGNFFGQADLSHNLSLRITAGTDYANRWRNTYYPTTTQRGLAVSGDALRASLNSTSWLNENTLTWQRNFTNQALNLLGGYSRQSTTTDNSSMHNTDFVSDITGYFDIGAGTQTGGPTVASSNTNQTLESWLSRANYSLLDRYLLTLTYRADGSSRFAANKKWGSFPSAAVAWRASSESWMQKVPQISDLKFRLSYGLVGNPSIRPYQSLAQLNNQTYSFGGTPASGYYTTVVGNPNLSWETTREADAGFDLGLWNRFTINADYYEKKTSDLLLQVNLPYETGFQSALANVGSVANAGVELGVDFDVLRGANARSFAWHSNVSFSKNKNRVLDLGGQQQIFADLLTTDYNLPGTLIQVGQPLGVFYGFKSGGVIRDSAQAAAIPYRNFNGSTFKPGQMLILKTTPGDTVTLADRTVVGDPTPDFNYGWTNTFSFRGIELTGLLQGQHGGKILNVNRIRTESSPRANISVDRFVNAWTPANPDAKYPAIGENPDQVGTNNFTDNLLESASYLRLRSLTVSYGLPPRVLGRLGASSARLYLTGTNLFTVSNYSGFDPDVSAQSVTNVNRGVDIGAYPLSRTFTLGLGFNY
jgi:TonB-dependent starch-binding outer membrane protein SusC